MDLIITALIVVAFVHYIYDRILLPTSRQTARSKIFALRDELRNELIANQGTYDSETLKLFETMDSRINHAVNRLHLFTFTNFVKVKMLPEEQFKEMDRFRQKLKDCESEVPREIHEKLSHILLHVLSMNSFLLVVWLLPIVLMVSMISKISAVMKKTSNDLADLVTGNGKDNFDRYA